MGGSTSARAVLIALSLPSLLLFFLLRVQTQLIVHWARAPKAEDLFNLARGTPTGVHGRLFATTLGGGLHLVSLGFPFELPEAASFADRE